MNNILENKNFPTFFTSNKTKGILCLWLLGVSIFGTQILMFPPIFLGITTTPFSMLAKGSTLLIALYLIFITLPFIHKAKISRLNILLLVFIGIYSIRLIYDVSFRHIHLQSSWYEGTLSASYIYMYSFGASFIPVLAIALNAKYCDLKQGIRILVIFSILQIMCISLELLKAFDFQLSLESFTNRYFLTSATTTDKGANPLNPILIARFGATNVIMISSLYLCGLRKYIKVNWVVSFFTISISIGIILLGGSRGPVLTLILTFLLIVAFYYKNLNINLKSITRNILILVIISSLIARFVNNINDVDLSVVNRTINFLEERKSGVKEARDYQWEAAINQFLSSPIIGDKIFEDYAEYYPHNVTLEVFMSTGLIGGIFYTFFIFGLFLKGYLSYKNKNGILYFYLLIVVVNFLFSTTSGNLFETPDFYTSIAFGAALSSRQAYC